MRGGSKGGGPRVVRRDLETRERSASVDLVTSEWKWRRARPMHRRQVRLDTRQPAEPAHFLDPVPKILALARTRGTLGTEVPKVNFCTLTFAVRESICTCSYCSVYSSY